MKLNKHFATALTFALFSGGLTPALAGNAGASLGQCVDHVVDTCNANSKRPALCAKGGIKACTKLHSGKKKPTAAAVINGLKAAGVPAQHQSRPRN